MAGVSVGTVDRIIHGRPKVSAKALARVNEVMEKIHYKPNLIARSLGHGRTHRIAVIIFEPKVEPYWAEAQLGISQAQAEWGHYNITIDPFYYVHGGEKSFDHVADMILKSKPDGVVLAPLYFQETLPVLKSLEENKVPYILFNTNIPESNALSFIGQDLFQSGMLAGQLMNLDHEKKEHLIILHVGEDVEDSIYLKEKERGFREYYQQKAPYSNTIESINADHTKDSFLNQIEKLIQDRNIKGIFVTTTRAVSTIAKVLLKSARKDIRLIGYDMMEDCLEYVKTGVIHFLINQNPKRQAFLGISHMANHLLFKKMVPATDLLPLEIITQQNVDSYIASGIH